MRYTTWLIYSDKRVIIHGGGYGLAYVNADGSVDFGFGDKDINKSNPYRDAPASDVKKIRNNALFVKMPKIDEFMGEGLLLVPEADPYFNLHMIFGKIYHLEDGVSNRTSAIHALSMKHMQENYL